ncbi:MAG: hypothetical protein COT09_05280 [Candidatus Hydromicrobium americanum]|nr:MAG: hypothetical protein COT09_05280 [Candidatus Hydromicrobium americanum]
MKMKNATGSSPVGVRIPKDIKRKFDEYCDRKGLRKSYLLGKIIEEKLLELEEDEMDLKLVEERMEEERITLEEFNKYMDKRIKP